MNRRRERLLNESTHLFENYCNVCDYRDKISICHGCPVGRKMSSIGLELIEDTRKKRTKKGVSLNIDECYLEHDNGISSLNLWTEEEDLVIINFIRIHGHKYGNGKKIASLLHRRNSAGVSRRIGILKEKGLLPTDD